MLNNEIGKTAKKSEVPEMPGTPQKYVILRKTLPFASTNLSKFEGFDLSLSGTPSTTIIH